MKRERNRNHSNMTEKPNPGTLIQQKASGRTLIWEVISDNEYERQVTSDRFAVKLVENQEECGTFPIRNIGNGLKAK